MNRQKKIASVLAGVSFVALSLAISPASADSITVNTSRGAVVVPSIEFSSSSYDFVTITGVGEVSETNAGSGDQTSFAVQLDATNAIEIGDFTNYGYVSATASATAGTDQDAFALAVDFHDIVTGINEDAYVSVSNETGAGIFAGAAAGGSSPEADATGVHQYAASSRDDASAWVGNYGDIWVQAYADGGDLYDAQASASALGVHQDVFGADNAEALLFNDGLINAHADASAGAIYDTIDSYVSADAGAAGVVQHVDTYEGDAYASVDNVASIGAVAHAYASGGNAGAYASASGVYQGAGSVYGTATADLTNDGNIYAAARADAAGLYDADATALAIGAGQEVYSYYNEAFASAVNYGDIYVDSGARAVSDGFADADATSIGIGQSIYSPNDAGSAIASNLGYDSAFAYSVAHSYDSDAHAGATAYGIAQESLTEGVADLTATNQGYINVGAAAIAYAQYDAYADVSVAGTIQYATSYDDINVTASNLGYISAEGYAVAAGVYAEASADVQGMHQIALADDGVVTADISNEGVIWADAYALAYGYQASAEANVVGMDQDLYVFAGSVDANATNDGAVVGFAYAEAFSFYSASASADIAGIHQQGVAIDAGGVSLAADNSGLIFVAAHANAGSVLGFDLYETEAFASAAGIAQDAYSVEELAHSSVVNSNLVAAWASADAYTVFGSAHAYASAEAVDSHAFSSDGSATVDLTNEGVLTAEAGAFSYTVIYGEAEATADVEIVHQVAYADDDATVDLTNTGLIYGESYALAISYNSSAYADSYAAGVRQNAFSDDGAATATLTNSSNGIYDSSGVIAVAAYATAYAEDVADANAEGAGVWQAVVTNTSGPALADLTNDGYIGVNAEALAVASNYAYASASGTGVRQDVYTDTGTVDAELTNSGEIYGGGVAFAYSDLYDAEADASGTGVYQFVYSHNSDPELDGEIVANLTNEGSIAGVSFATAISSQSDAFADAEAHGVYQFGVADNRGDVSLSLVNDTDGLIYASAFASAIANDYASASVTAHGVHQRAYAEWDNASADVENDGTISALAVSNAWGGTTGAYDTAVPATAAYASAEAAGVEQDVSARLTATASLTNSSDFSIHGNAYASAYASQNAEAVAYGAGVWQDTYSETSTAENFVDNSGYIQADASAYASATTADGDASAYAFATGVGQSVFGEEGGTNRFTNSGLIEAGAYAYTFADDEYAVARAIGHYAGGYGEVDLDVTNEATGEIDAYAFVSATDGQAFALGGWYGGLYATSLEGEIRNDGFIFASATAYAGGSAQAIGVLETTNAPNNTEITNTGGIFAYAYVDGGVAAGPGAGIAQATGIAIAGYANNQYDGETVVNNDGGLISAYTEDANGTYRGNAINTRGVSNRAYTYTAASNPVVINLTGGDANGYGKYAVTTYDLASAAVQAHLSGQANYGYIYGNIQLTEDDTVNVQDGATIFDGEFNSDGLNYGTLNINDGGELLLVQNTEDGPNGGSVGELNVYSGGSFGVELTPDDNPGAYPTLDATNVYLEGNLVVVYDAGLYGDSGYYDDVITSENEINTVFSNVTDNVALLDTYAIYDGSTGGGSSVDIGYERVAFDAVGGETKNQKSVGGAIEDVYPEIDPDTDFGQLVANMFTLNDKDYKDMLDQLSGAQYANHLQSVLWSTRAIDRVITNRMECSGDTSYDKTASIGDAKVGDNTVTPTADVISSTGCFRPGEANIWMSGYGQWNNLSGDNEAPGYDESQYGILFGADYAFTESLFFGLAGGYFNSTGDFDNWGGANGASIDYSGLQLAAYGGYDNSQYYLRGIVAYGNYDGDSHRQIALQGARQGETYGLSGDPSSDTWSFYGETGYRFGLGSVGQITPFLGLSLATATLDGFTEKDPDGSGAALKVHESDASSVASVLGARFTADMSMGSGVFSPVLSVAWMHEFDDTHQTVHMSFADAPSGANFNVIGSDVARDTAVVDAGAKFEFNDALNLGIYYNGMFNADYTSNAVTATLGYKF